MRSTSPSRCSCSSASRRFDRCPSCPSSSTTTSTRCARWRLLHWPHRPLQQMRERGRASPANVKSGWPGPIPKCHACIGPPHRPRPARTCARTIARTTARTHAHARPQTWPGAFAQMSARFHPRYACTRARYGGCSELCDRASPGTPAVWVAAISDPIGSCSGGLVHFGLASQQSVGVCR